jgi:hypothetical protein
MIARVILSIVVGLFIFSAVCYSRDENARETLQYYLSIKDERGNVFYQSRLDGINYKKLLRAAMNQDTESLEALFEYSSNKNLMGEGAEDHVAILRALLCYLGDDLYSTALRNVSRKSRKQVIGYLDEGFGKEDYSKKYPKTYAVCAHHRLGKE